MLNNTCYLENTTNLDSYEVFIEYFPFLLLQKMKTEI